MNYLWSTAPFVTYGTGGIAAFVNSGAGFYTDGRVNDLVHSVEMMSFSDASASFSDVKFAILMLTDGSQ